MAKVFITRYALTSGIKEVETEIYKSDFKNSPNYIISDNAYNCHYIGKDAFIDKSEALNKAEDMRKKKIVSLRKQIEKLEKLSFNE